jgi:hypothetical protein
MLYSLVLHKMKRNRRSSKAGIDLIGFLDILSVVIVIVLLVISVLALSIGVQGSVPVIQDEVSREAPAPTQSIAQRPAQAEIRTVDGRIVTAETAFLLCKGDQLQQFDPVSGERITSWTMGINPVSSVANQIRQSNVYLSVAGSCFPYLDDLVSGFQAMGMQLGYEPTTEDAVVPWQ